MPPSRENLRVAVRCQWVRSFSRTVLSWVPSEEVDVRRGVRLGVDRGFFNRMSLDGMMRLDTLLQFLAYTSKHWGDLPPWCKLPPDYSPRHAFFVVGLAGYLDEKLGEEVLSKEMLSCLQCFWNDTNCLQQPQLSRCFLVMAVVVAMYVVDRKWKDDKQSDYPNAWREAFVMRIEVAETKAQKKREHEAAEYVWKRAMKLVQICSDVKCEGLSRPTFSMLCEVQTQFGPWIDKLAVDLDWD